MSKDRRPCNSEQNHIQRQVDEDTCAEHEVFCCPECFDMTIPKEDEDDLSLGE